MIHEKDFDTIVTYLMSDIGSSWNSASSIVKFNVLFSKIIMYKEFWGNWITNKGKILELVNKVNFPECFGVT